MIATPAICASRVECSRRNCPAADAVAPSVTNTVAKPSTNMSAGMSTMR
jgi:hypothetical protein